MAKRLKAHPLRNRYILAKAQTIEEIESLLSKGTAVPPEFEDHVVGCIKQAHEVDVNLKADVMFENLAAKLPGALARDTMETRSIPVPSTTLLRPPKRPLEI